MIFLVQRCAVAAALLGAVACAPGTVPIKSVALVDGDITATAPVGYCVDQQDSRPADGFAVMAPCATLGADVAAPDVIGFATVQVGAPDSSSVSGAEKELRQLLTSDAGAVLLSALGDAETVKVIATEVDDNKVTVHFSDSADAPINGLGNEEWRAFLDLNGRLVTVAIRGLTAAPLAQAAGSLLLDRVVTGLGIDGSDAPES